MKPKTPEQLAAKEAGRDKVTLYLSVENMNKIREHATKVGISASVIVDEAIASYLKHLRSK